MQQDQGGVDTSFGLRTSRLTREGLEPRGRLVIMTNSEKERKKGQVYFHLIL